ncbi:hypothetical protein M413DRAFT_44893, partial [Hebeloma cylindrosporum]
YQILTSTRYDQFLTTLPWNNDEDGPSPFLLLLLHLDRLLAATETHNWLYAKSLLKYRYLRASCLDAISEQRMKGSNAQAFRLRITVSKEGRLVVTATPLDTSFTTDPTLTSLIKPPIPLSEETNVVKVYIDIQETTPSVFTQTKTTLRGLYEAAKERNKPTEDEKGDWDVLLHNEDGKVMETTIFNIAFYRSSRWLTPCTSTGCLGGVMRQWLLRAGRIMPDSEDNRGESTLRKENIVNGECVLLFNGVQGCRLGRI